MKNVKDQKLKDIPVPITFYQLEDLLHNEVLEENQNASEFVAKVITSDTCRQICFKQVYENGIITPEEKQRYESYTENDLKHDLKKNTRISRNAQFDHPVRKELISGYSAQSYTIRIPTADMQIRILLLQLALSALSYQQLYNYSYGYFAKRSVLRIEKDITNAIQTHNLLFGFSAHIKVYNSGNFLSMLNDTVPLEEWLIKKLIKYDNLTVHQMYPETAGLTNLPNIEESLHSFWMTHLIQQVKQKNDYIFIYKNQILVLCPTRKEREECLERFNRIMPGYGVVFDYGSNLFNIFNTQNGFTFLNKTYVYDQHSVQCQPEKKLLLFFLEYLDFYLEDSFETLPEKETEINRIIFILNVIFQGLPESFIHGKYLKTIEYSRHNKFPTLNYEDIKSQVIETDAYGRKHYRLKKDGCEGLDDLLSKEDFKYNNARIDISEVGRDRTCKICGKRIPKEDLSFSLTSGNTAVFAHLHCIESVHEQMNNLLKYRYPDLVRMILGAEAFKKPEEFSKKSRPKVTAKWKYYPLYVYFSNKKSKTVTMTFKDMENILGFKIKPELKSYDSLKKVNRSHLQFKDSWELAGYFIKSFPKDPEGKITFEESNYILKDVTGHPLTKKEIPPVIYNSVTQFLNSLFISQEKSSNSLLSDLVNKF